MSEQDVFSNVHEHEVLAATYVREDQAYEVLLTNISIAQWDLAIALRKNKSPAEIDAKRGKVQRLEESQSRYLAGARPSQYIRVHE